MSDQDDPQRYLAPTRFIDSDHPAVLAYANAFMSGSLLDRAVALFRQVRDSIRYDPYHVLERPEDYRASALTTAERGFCIPKAILLAASCRAIGIPSRLGFADVRNHLASERFIELLGTDLFVFHGYADLYLEGRWVKATPAFDARLCHRFGVKPLEFDGRNDALFHEFTPGGRRYMEYVRDRGVYEDFPLEEMIRALNENYGDVLSRLRGQRDAAFHR